MFTGADIPSSQTPRPLQLVREQFNISHPSPIHGESHEHTPMSHDPWLLQSGSIHSTSWTHKAVETARAQRYSGWERLRETEDEYEISGITRELIQLCSR